MVDILDLNIGLVMLDLSDGTIADDINIFASGGPEQSPIPPNR